MIILDQRLIEQEEEKEEKGIDKLRISGRLNTAGIRFFRRLAATVVSRFLPT